MNHPVFKALFGSKWSVMVSVFALACAGAMGWQVLQWGVLQANFRGSDASACSGQGACWVYVVQHSEAFLYGAFYPKSEIWRIQLLVASIGIGTIAWLKTGRSLRGLLVLAYAVVPLSGYWLIFGGWGLSPVKSSQSGGLVLTVIVSYVGILASLPLGVLLALGRRSRHGIIHTASVVFIEFWRGVPLITVLFMASVMLPLFLPRTMDAENFDKLLRCLIGVTLFSSAYMAEVVRGGLQTVGDGQIEASHALGLGYVQTMMFIVLPQALRRVIPAIINNFIGLFKDTTLVMIIGMFDLLGAVQASLTNTAWLGYNLEAYVFTGAVYWIFCFGLSYLSQKLETRFGIL